MTNYVIKTHHVDEVVKMFETGPRMNNGLCDYIQISDELAHEIAALVTGLSKAVASRERRIAELEDELQRARGIGHGAQEGW